MLAPQNINFRSKITLLIPKVINGMISSDVFDVFRVASSESIKGFPVRAMSIGVYTERGGLQLQKLQTLSKLIESGDVLEGNVASVCILVS